MAWIPRTEENYHKLILEAETKSGVVRGLPGGNRICSVFKGIPYAAAPVGELRYENEKMVITGGKIGPLTQKIYDTITGIQLGKLEGPEGWSVEVK